MPNFRLIFEYDGSRYIGWQQQENLVSVEGTLRAALEQLLQQKVDLIVAGRTDAGVHARAQVVNFFAETELPARKLAPGLNYYLPRDISVHLGEEVPDSFNAKLDSLSKIYRYRVYQGPQRAALATRSWHVRKPLNVEAMRAAAEHLIGELDFNAFRSVHCDASHAVREMFSIDIRQVPRPPVGHTVDIFFHANAYCRHMCRILAGTLVEVGMGRRSPQDVQRILASRDRTQAGITAPPSGLTLMEVRYPS